MFILRRVSILNRAVTSKEAIIMASKEIVIDSGMHALNIREVAKRCNASVGSIYNYFPSKEDLVMSTVRSIWAEIFQEKGDDASQDDFIAYVESLFRKIQKGSEKYPFFISAHGMNFTDANKNKGRETMNQFFSRIEFSLLDALKKDQNTKADIFTEEFTETDFVSFIFSNIRSLIIEQNKSCKVLLEVVKKILY